MNHYESSKTKSSHAMCAETNALGIHVIVRDFVSGHENRSIELRSLSLTILYF